MTELLVQFVLCLLAAGAIVGGLIALLWRLAHAAFRSER